MRKYWTIFLLSFQNTFEYRMNFLWGIFGTLVGTLILYVFWTAVLGVGFGDGKYTSASLGLYYLSIAFVTMFTDFGYHEVADDIRDGDLSIDLLKPYNYFLKIFSDLMPDRLIVLVPFGIIYLFLFFLGLESGIKTGNLLPGGLALILALIMRFLISSSFGALAFWFKRVHGFNALFFNLGGLFSGALIPIDLLPSNLLSISDFLPFKYFTYSPVKLLLSGSGDQNIWQIYAIQIFWILFFLILFKFIWQKGIAKFEATGR